MQVDAVSLDTVDSACSFLCTLNGKKILFNCGEGFQRLGIEERLKISRLEALFISKLDWKHLGGFPGLLLTLSDGGANCLTLVGPVGLKVFLASMNSFLKRRGFKLEVFEVSPADGKTHLELACGFKIECFASEEASEAAKSPVPLVSQVISSMFDCKGEMEPHLYPDESAQLMHIPGSFCFPSSSVSVSYLAVGPSFAGRLDVQIARALGVPKGPLLGELVKGNQISLPDGRVISPELCVGSRSIPQAFMLIELDSVSAFHRFLQCNSFGKILDEKLELKLVVHKVPSELKELQQYSDWRNSLSGAGQEQKAKHFFVSTCSNSSLEFFPLNFKSTALLQQRMQFATEGSHFSTPFFTLNSPMHPDFIQPQMRFLLSPHFPLEWELVNSTAEMPVAQEAFIPKEDFVLFLGTGSALPSKYRNVSGILIGFPAQSAYFLFDCGEGTFGQICRKFGPFAKEICANIRGIFLSHLHADHHLGTMSFIQKHLHNQDLTIYAPSCLASWFDNYSRLDAGMGKFNFVLLDANYSGGQSTLLSFRAVPVIHCHESFGIIASFQRSNSSQVIKVAYSGDTRPCKAFVEASMHSDIFIHEATFNDSMELEAEQRQHCTASQAIQCFKASGSKYGILTHFSQRYPKYPEVVDSSENIAIAFDGMHFFFDQITSKHSHLACLRDFFLLDDVSE